MRKAAAYLVSAAALLLCVPAHAEGHLAFRGGLSYGTFDGNENGLHDAGNPWSAGVGINLGIGRAFVDLGLDYYDLSSGLGPTFKDDIRRTDMTLTAGARVASKLTVFGGLREAWMGEKKAFDAAIWKEYGIFVGPGIGPFAMGPMNLSASAAYNFNRLDDSGCTTPSGGSCDTIAYNGVSAKLRLGLSKTGHALEARFQHFETTSDNTLGLSNRCTYFLVGYVFTWTPVHF